jgi:general secretion pathway protein C
MVRPLMLDRMTLLDINTTTLFKNAAKWLPLLQWCGWVFAVFILAKIFWLWTLYFTAPTEFKPVAVAPSAVKRSSNNLDVNQLVNLNLFGSVVKDAPKIVVQESAPETKLNLKLRGIYASNEKDKANAIIEDGRGKQSVYFIDEKLAVSGRVYLRQVYVDKVILETNGKSETLKLIVDKLVGSVIRELPKKKASKKNIQDKRNNQRISRKLNDYKKKLLTDPKSVSDVISGRPHFVEGELLGFSISPGKDKRLFQELGLRRGDLVTSINGVSLTNMQDAMTLMNDAQSIVDLNVTIERDGQPLSLLLNLNDKVGM